MDYRKFKLLNNKGDEYTLTEQNFKVFGNNPQGLGFSKSLSTIRLGDEELLLYSMVNLDNITMELLFYDDGVKAMYEDYLEFMSFISFKPIYLLYQTPNSFDWYRRRVEIVSLSKTEVDTDSILHCPIQMKPLGFWEDNEVNVIEIDNSEGSGGKIYPINYPINYGSSSFSNIHMVSKGLLDTPIEITIDGSVENPEWVLYDNDNNIYGRARFNGIFDSVYVNSRESEEEIKLLQNGIYLDNPLSYQDITVGSPNEINVTFLKLKVGTSKLSFLFGLDFDGSVKIRWRNRYVSV